MSVLRIIVMGLGNPILGDDGVGWHVVNAVRQSLSLTNKFRSEIELETMAVGGLSLMERLIDYDIAIIVDAVQTNSREIGTVFTTSLEGLSTTNNGHTGSAHDTNLYTAVQMGLKMGLNLPEKIIVMGIEANKVYDFSEELSPSIKNSIPLAAQLILDQIRNLEAVP